MKKLSILFAAVMLVGLATVAMAGPRGQGRGMGPGSWGQGMGMGPGYGAAMVPGALAKLNLTADQAAKIQTLREGYLKEVMPLRNERFSKRAELRLLWAQTNPDEGKIRAKQEEINKLREQIQEKNTTYRLGVRKILTPEQWAQLIILKGKQHRHGGGRPLGQPGMNW